MKKTSYLIVLICLVFLSSFSIAQDEDVTDLDYIWGSVESISDNEIVISTFDYNTEENVQKTYSVIDDVELVNLTALTDLSNGDMVDLVVEEKNGNIVVTSISVDKIDVDDEDLEYEDNDEQLELDAQEDEDLYQDEEVIEEKLDQN